MKKRVISLMLLSTLVLSLFLTGCHGSKGMDAFTVPETFDSERDYEINFWAKNDTNMTQVEIYKQAIQDFEALYPNIHVNLRLYTDYGRIYNDVITNIPQCVHYLPGPHRHLPHRLQQRGVSRQPLYGSPVRPGRQ